LLVEALHGLGMVVNEADDFHRARDVLASTRPDILITELRLGAYNGLHLVLRCKAARPEAKAMVLTRAADPVLKQEAAQLDAELVVKGQDAAWLASIVAAVGSHVAARQVLAFRPVEGA
jgi:DNA-binding NarL/FixJ family response regulator